MKELIAKIKLSVLGVAMSMALLHIANLDFTAIERLADDDVEELVISLSESIRDDDSELQEDSPLKGKKK